MVELERDIAAYFFAGKQWPGTAVSPAGIISVRCSAGHPAARLPNTGGAMGADRLRASHFLPAMPVFYAAQKWKSLKDKKKHLISIVFRQILFILG